MKTIEFRLNILGCFLLLAQMFVQTCHAQTGLAINEVAYEEWFFSDNDQHWGYGWIELKNNSITNLNTGSFYLKLNDNQRWRLPDIEIKSDAYLFVWLSGKDRNVDVGNLHASFIIENPRNEFVLYDSLTGITLDSIIIANRPYWNESRSRFPENSDNWYNSVQRTPSAQNVNFGPWRKVSTFSNFSPRDSSPNATLFFDGKLWIFEGWEGGGGEEAARSNVWSSTDGADWTLINDSPPYYPYACYVAFDGYMWALEDKAYRTKDGIHWEMVSDNIPVGVHARVVAFKEHLIAINGNSIYKSFDGKTWSILTDDAPFGYREFPAVVTLNDKIWLYGGGINYFTGFDEYFNDVWVSEDGEIWEPVVLEAEWPGRLWSGFASFDNKLWVLGGWNYYNRGDQYYGNRNDVWYSEDGIEWKELVTANSWLPRHAPLVWTTDDALYFGAGFLNNFGLFNDVWKLERSENIEANVFYLKPDMGPSILSSWGTNKDGSGFSPKGFQYAYQEFHLLNSDSIVIKKDWVVTGENSIAVLGDGKSSMIIEIPKGIDVNSKVELRQEVELRLKGNQKSPNLSKVASNSSIIVGDNVSLNARELGQVVLNGTVQLDQSPTVKSGVIINGDGSIEEREFTFKYVPGAFLTFNANTDRKVKNQEWPVSHPPSRVSINCECTLERSGDASTDTLALVAGKFQIHDGSLSVKKFVEFSSTSYIITDDNGFVESVVDSSGTVYPIGRSVGFAPVKVSSLKVDIVKVRALTLDTLRIQANALDIGWEILGRVRGPEYLLDLSWTANDEGDSFVDTLAALQHFDEETERWEVQEAVLSRESGYKSLFSSQETYGLFSIQQRSHDTDFDIKYAIFPNPATDYLSISAPKLKDAQAEIKIITATGKVVDEVRFVSKHPIYQFRLNENIPTGLYIIRVAFGNSVIKSKVLIIQK